MKSPEKTREELICELDQLRQELSSFKALYETTVNDREHIAFNLQERLKELECQNRISEIMSNQALPVDEVLEQIVQIIPPAWQFPEQTGARIEIQQKVFSTRLYRNDVPKLSEEIHVYGRKAGKIDVCLSGELPVPGAIAFLPEESVLLKSIALRLGIFIEKAEKEMALTESEALYGSIISASPDLITITDLEGKVIFTSPKASEMFGADNPEIFAGHHMLEYIDPADHERAITGFTSMIGGNYLGAAEYKGVRLDGSKFEIEVNGEVIRDEHGNPVRMIFVTRDISDRKAAERKLAQSEESYKSLIENLNDVVYEISAEGIVNYVSPSIEKFLGYTPDELTGRNFFQNMHADDRPQILQRLSQLDKRDYSFLEYRYWSKDGHIHWVRSSTNPIIGDGKVKGGRGVLIDVTERRKAELAIAASEQKYRALFDESPDGILIFRGEHFVECNAAVEKMLGGDKSMIIGKTPGDISPEYQPNGKTSAEYAAQVVRETYEHKRNSFEFLHRRFDGSDFLVQVDLSVIDYDGYQALLVTWRDITKLREAEDLLRRLSSAVDQSPVSIVITNTDGNIEYANPKACETTGYTLEELKGQNPRVLKSGETKMEEYSKLWETIASGKAWKGIFHNRKKNGEYYWESSTISPIIDNKGHITHYLAVKEDITKRKETEDQLRNSEEKYRLIFETVRDVYYEASLEGEILEISPSISILTKGQYTREDLIGKPMAAFYEDPDYRMTFLSALSKTGSLSDFELRLRNRDGAIIPASVSSGIIFDKNGKPLKITGSLRDISERKRAEEEMRKFRTIADMANYGIALAGLDGTMIYANNAFAHMHGWEVSEVTGKNLSMFHSEEQMIRVRETIELLQKDGQFIAEEVWRTRKDGSVFPSLMNAMIIMENNQPQFMSATAIDITELKESEKKIRHQNNRLNAIIEAMPDLVFVSDNEGNYLEFFSKSSEDLLIPQERLVGSNVRDSFDAETAGLHIRKINECIDQKKLVNYEYTGSKNGDLRYYEARIVYLEENRVLRFVRNITERKLRDMEIRKLNLAIEQSPVSIVITDLESNIQYVSPAFQSITGYTPEEVIGKQPNILKSGITPREVYGDLWNSIKQGKSWQGEWMNRKKDGSLFWESISITPIVDEQGKTTNFLAIKQDISERKKSEKEIRDLNANLEIKIAERTAQLSESNQSLLKEIEERKQIEEQLWNARQEAEQANQAKSEFLSRMSHELRTPMNSILGFAQLLDMGELNQGQRKGIGHIIRSGKHLLQLINEVLDISRIEAGRISLSMEPVELSGVIREMIDTVQVHAAGRQIRVKYIETEALYHSVQTDRQKLKQIFLNLLSNSIKYNKEGGSVWIKADVMPEQNKGEVPVRISVTDTGYGISPQDLPRLFTPFERIGAEKSETEGTGLGLAVVKKLVEIMGGNIGVESIPGEGSTFWIEFIRVENQLEHFQKGMVRSGPVMQNAGKTGCILYVEDNGPNIELVQEILQTSRPNIRLATTMYGKQAVDFAIENRPGLILLDLNLPDMHGSDVLKRLLEEPKTREIPVVILSADAMHVQLDKLLKAGAKAYLTKPLEVLNFLETIDQHLLDL